MSIANRSKGALLGLAIGDALGCTSEFYNPGEFIKIYDIRGGGVFNLKPGHWTDDTSLALCLADSLLATNKFDSRDQLNNYVKWLQEGYRSSIDRAFDVGFTTGQALTEYLKTNNEFPGIKGEYSAGNGSIMRLAPVPLFFHNSIKGELLNYCALSSRTTHAEPICEEACQLMGLWIQDALTKSNFNGLALLKNYIEIIEDFNKRNIHSELKLVLEGRYKDPEQPIISSGYVVHTLEVALWAIENSNSFEEGMLKVVNLGGDADTAGAVFGQLSGATYGVDAIPERWKKKVYLRDEIEKIALELIRKI